MRKQSLLILFFAFISNVVFTQQINLNGHINDSVTGESLVGVTVYIPKLEKGTVTNNYGYYSLIIPEGKYEIIVSYIGYRAQTYVFDGSGDVKQDFSLQEENVHINEVQVTAYDASKKIMNAQLGTEILPIKNIKALPTIAGETDILKVVQLMPGIQAESEGSSGFNVRGGNYDQNLVLLDEAVVYNPGHIFGIFSVFNDDAINSATVNKGDMPAKYGGRLSSVVDIVAKEGNNKNFSMRGGIGLLSSKLTVEGPVAKGKGSYIISGRRTYLDLIAKPLTEASGENDGSSFYFYDINAKINYKVNDKNRVYLSLYQGKDKFLMKAEDNRFSWDLPWGNFTSTLRWNHILSNRLFVNTSLIHNSFFRDFTETQEGFTEVRKSKISDQGLKLDMYYNTSFNHTIKFGAQATLHKFNNSSNSNENPEQYASDISAYILDEFSVFKKLLINIGLRYTLFSNIGPYAEYALSDDGEEQDPLKKYSRFETINSYNRFEPRLAARYLLTEKASVKASYSENSQFINLISNMGTTLPFDSWIPSSKAVKPQKSRQYALGYFQLLGKRSIQASVEVYYKEMENQIELSEQFVPDFSGSSTGNYVFGDGTARGVEVSVKKSEGKLQGWVAYTLSDSKRQFDDLNDGKEFYASNDVRHDLSVSGSYILSPKWSFGLTFLYRTGKPFTIPESRFFANGEIIDQYGERNNYRLPDYNRMDISATYRPNRKPDKRLKSEWIFAIYNVYNKYNPTYIYFEDEGSVKENNFTTQAKSIALIPFMPSVTWRFKF